MRNAVLALSFTAFFISAEITLADRGRGPRSGVPSERAARAEERSRVETTRICRGCNVTQQPNSRSADGAIRSVRARAKVRSGSVWMPIPALPLTSGSERQVQALNNTMIVQQQWRLFQQQTQFEINQLRSELQRDRLFLQRD
jgi:hypothetical protein